MTSPIRVLAIDPGERVGWATGVVNEVPVQGDEHSGVHTLEVTSHGISRLKDFGIKMHEVLVTDPKYDVLIYETWRLRAGQARKFAGNDFQPVQLIGMARLCAWLNPHVQLVSRPPGVAQPDSVARKTVAAHPQGEPIQAILDNLPKTHDDAHDGDALLHLWAWYWEKFL